MNDEDDNVIINRGDETTSGTAAAAATTTDLGEDYAMDILANDDFGLTKQGYYVSCPAGECCLFDGQSNGLVVKVSPLFNLAAKELTVVVEQVWKYDPSTKEFQNMFESKGCGKQRKGSVECPLLCFGFVSNYTSGTYHFFKSIHLFLFKLFLFYHRKETWIAVKCPQSIELLSLDIITSLESSSSAGPPVGFAPRLGIPFLQKDVSLFWLCDGPSFVVAEKDPQFAIQKDTHWMRANCECWIKTEFGEPESTWSHHSSALQFSTAFSANIANVRLLSFLCPVFVQNDLQPGIAILGPLRADDGSFVFGKLASFGIEVENPQSTLSKVFWSVPKDIIGKVTSVAYCWDQKQGNTEQRSPQQLVLRTPLRMLFGLSDSHIKMYSGGIPLLSEKLSFVPNAVRFVGQAADSSAVVLAESYRKACLLRWETMLLASKLYVSDPACIHVNEFDQNFPGRACAAALPWAGPDAQTPCWRLHDVFAEEPCTASPTAAAEKLCNVAKANVEKAGAVLAGKYAELDAIQASVTKSLLLIEKLSKTIPKCSESGDIPPNSQLLTKQEFLIENIFLPKDIHDASFPLDIGSNGGRSSSSNSSNSGNYVNVCITGISETGKMAVLTVEGAQKCEKSLLIDSLQDLAKRLNKGESTPVVRPQPFSNETKRILWSALRSLEKIAAGLEKMATADESSMNGIIKEVVSVSAQLDLEIREMSLNGLI